MVVLRPIQASLKKLFFVKILKKKKTRKIQIFTKFHFSRFFNEACIGHMTTMMVSKRFKFVQKTFWNKF